MTMQLVQVFPAIKTGFQPVKTAEVWLHHNGVYDVIELNPDKSLAHWEMDILDFTKACDIASRFTEEKANG